MSSEWPLRPLGELTINHDGKRKPVKESERKRGPYPYYGASGIVDYVDGYLFDGDYLLIGEDGENMRTRQTPIAFMANGKFWVNNHAHIVTGNHLADTRFLMYAVLNADIHAYLTGAVMPKLTQGNLNKIQLRCPSLDEQKEIVSMLGALDDRIALLRDTNATLEAIAQAMFKSWFVDFDPVHAKQQGRAPEGMSEATAALFPDSFEESELGLVPKGWKVAKFGGFINRISVGKKYDQKSALPEGEVPILDQGKSGVIGFHNDAAGIEASLDEPVVVFANHTCYMRLIAFPFSAIQNVLPFKGKDVDTIWAFYATKDRLSFSEYKGHWPDFAIEKAVVPNTDLTQAFRNIVDPLVRRIRINEVRSETLTTLRDTLLPRLISGQLRLGNDNQEVETTL
ncbi:MAG: restriction endonuclease subunit S [Gallionellaceae bacterium]|jgi:type I restriction enzyme S subunit